MLGDRFAAELRGFEPVGILAIFVARDRLRSAQELRARPIVVPYSCCGAAALAA